MRRGIENYEGKEICILGGGDGALLYELLKENPKHVVMLEIDEVVMVACNKYLRSICGDVLEVRNNDQFEVNKLAFILSFVGDSTRTINVDCNRSFVLPDYCWRLYGLHPEIHQ